MPKASSLVIIPERVVVNHKYSRGNGFTNPISTRKRSRDVSSSVLRHHHHRRHSSSFQNDSLNDINLSIGSEKSQENAHRDWDTTQSLYGEYLSGMPHLTVVATNEIDWMGIAGTSHSMSGRNAATPSSADYFSSSQQKPNVTVNSLYNFIIQSVAWSSQGGGNTTMANGAPLSAGSVKPSVTFSTSSTTPNTLGTSHFQSVPHSKRSSSADLVGIRDSLLRDHTSTGTVSSAGSTLGLSSTGVGSGGIASTSGVVGASTGASGAGASNTTTIGTNLTTANTKIRHNLGYLRCAITIDASRQYRRLRYVLYDLLRNGQFEYGGIRYHLGGWNVTLLTDTDEVLSQMSSMEKDILSMVMLWNHQIEEEWMKKVMSQEEIPQRLFTEDEESTLPETHQNKRHTLHSRNNNAPPERFSRRSITSAEIPTSQQSFSVSSQVPHHNSIFSAPSTTNNRYSSVISPLQRMRPPSIISHTSTLGSPFHKDSLRLSVPPHSAITLLESHTTNPFEEYHIDIIRQRFKETLMHLSVRQFARDVIIAVRGHPLRKLLLSPRSTEQLEEVAKGYAIYCGSPFVLPTHVASVAPYVLSHRITLNTKKMNGGESLDREGGSGIRSTYLLTRQIVATLPRP